ncbi:MAG: Zn-dependent exopeptidase M28 [Oscillospiraceae bacterium]|nr:Zn-dependent exopeptidase M28 [Oscillospiraceae bacterium]
MLLQSQKIMSGFQVRKSKKQKEAFRAWLCGELEAAGYTPKVEKGFAARNVVAGDPETAKVIFSAHYDTCAVLPIPNFITPRNLFIYMCYQLLLVIPVFLVIAVAEGVLIAAAEALGVWQIMVLAPVLSMALCFFFCWWILDGPANQHTANDNTSGVITLLETALAMPEEDREKVCFVFFDNEEKGLFGSAAFTKAHKKAKKETLNINFDCVSDGDYIQFFPAKPLKRDGEALERVEAAFRGRGEKKTEVVRGFGFYPSDNRAFKRGVGVCALRHKRIIGYYMGRIHTNKDTVLEEENIALLRDGALRLAAAEKISNQDLT